MKKGLLKKILALVSAGIIACSVGITTAFAESTSPVADPDYVEITLEEFKEQNPDYQGYPEKEKPSASTYAVSASVEWRLIGGKYYLYYTATNTKVINDWYLENGNWYFLKPTTGEMAVGWCQVGIYWYYFNGGGVMQIDWYGISGKWYYLRTPSIPGDGKPEGSMLIGAWYLNATKGAYDKKNDIFKNYYFDESGAMQDWTYPLDATISANRSVSSPFRGTREHNGLDISSSYAAPVKSAIGGQVVYAAKQASMGNCVIEKSSVKDPNGKQLYVRYMHMSKLNITGTTAGTDSRVYTNAGDKIGEVGNTGSVSPMPTSEKPYDGTHLHIDMNKVSKANAEVFPDEAYNPAAFFTSISFTGKTVYGEQIN